MPSRAPYPSVLQIPASLWLPEIPEPTLVRGSPAAACSLLISRTLYPFQAKVNAPGESRNNQCLSKPLNVQRIKGGAGTRWSLLPSWGRKIDSVCSPTDHIAAPSQEGTGCWNSQLYTCTLTWSCPAFCLTAGLSLMYIYRTPTVYKVAAGDPA